MGARSGGVADATSGGDDLARRALRWTAVGAPVSAVLVAALGCVLPVMAGHGIAL